MARRMGVGGFPTCVLQEGTRHRVLASGYRPLDALVLEIEPFLNGADGGGEP